MSASNVVLLPYMPASVPAARWRLAADLRDAGIAGPAIGDAALVLSELLSNAILHARPLDGSALRVAWGLADGWIEVSVSDGGSSTQPHTEHPPPSAVHGRGLSIVENLSSRWGVQASGHETTVWAILPAPGGGHGNGHRDSAPTHRVAEPAYASRGRVQA